MNTKKNVYKVKYSDNHTYIVPPEDYNVLYYPTSFGHEILDKEYFCARKDFDFYMINYTVSGTGNIIYDGKTHRLKAGDLCFIYLGNESVYYPTGDDLEIYFFHIRGSNIKHFYKNITKDGVYVLENFPIERVKKAFSDLKVELIENNSYFETSKVINSFLTDIFEFSLTKKPQPYSQFIFNIILCLRNGENVTVSDIAEKMGYNPIYLERVYKKATGHTLKEDIAGRNLDRAENLLLTTDLSVAEIADALGYASSNGFISFFKKVTGQTPLEFRKKK